ncbi:exosome complex component RRP46 [Macrosteles quadrilineatus]|uniref:exosome complex component RRP46 n=1 Tax=Macrosteles quadrilineatus TaxID=74068 RepID=UPI0023E16CDA|nr:exosome complex component RRP46 [Macrosteles quadrilineatus]
MENNSVEVTRRNLKCEMNVLKNPDGSALLSQGETVYLAAVYGPIEVKMQKFQIDKACIETSYKPKSGQSCVSDRIKENFIKNICEAALLTSLHPRTAINIVVQEMQDCGGGLACAVNAACLALINSGLSMEYLVAAVSCMIDEDGEVIVDPDNKQLQGAQGTMTIVFDNVLCDIIGLHTDGLISEQQHQEAVTKCRLCAEQFFVYLRDVVCRYAGTI